MSTRDATAAGEQRPDLPHRRRIVEALDETLFVEAGAGSGKTRALVDRIEALVTGGRASLDAVAAITFTEKAAAELRDRVRRRLDDGRRAALGDGDADVATRCGRALDALDGAAVGTLHSFAQRILIEHPIEAGLPPRVEVLDEVASAVAFDNRWAGFVDELLADRAVERSLLLATSAGVRVDALRTIAIAFNQNWDLVVERAPSEPVEPPDWLGRLDTLLDELDGACAERTRCLDGGDHLHGLLCDLADWSHQVRAVDDEYAKLALLSGGGRPTQRANGKGRKDRWPPDYDLNGLRALVDDINDRCDDLRTEVAHTAVVRLAVELRRFTLHAAEERRAAGQLEFHDLLVMARQMLRDPVHGPGVRATLHRRYRHLLIDEFQDTDPIQVELATLIASPDPADGQRPWHDIDTRPGHLFFVGDPKQSIYRFRRADISLFLRAAERFGTGDRKLALTTNHRSVESLARAANRLFGHLITRQDRDGSPSQPAYEPFVPVRPDPPVGPPVAVLGRAVHTDRPRAGELRAREAGEVAATIGRILGEGWQVDRSTRWEHPDWHPARLGDITILIPTRMSLPALEDALSDAGIAYRAESASLVYASRLVRDLLLALRAIDDPTDELSTVAALRSPLFACGDDDLFRFKQRGGRFNHARRLPDAVPDHDVVARGLAYLHDLHDERRWTTPSELLDRLVRDRRVMELGEAEGRARDLWRRVRFVIDQARAWCETTDGTLRQYLEWIRQQTAEGSRVAEAVLPETDDDAVRIMTIHASKGLQFPITVVAGLSTRPQQRAASAEVAWPPSGECLIRIGRKVTSPAYEAWRPIDEQMAHDERVRLLYVACTRARDHLVVSLHRSERRSSLPEDGKLTSAEVVARAAEAVELLDELPDAVDVGADAAVPESEPSAAAAAGAADAGAPGPDATPAARAPAPLPPFDEWRATR
ncbi:MAG: UvrD-helicase domain-containing protein, partial [Acidimicrobiia bacterium]